jgi:hypothetical protein
VSGRRLAACAAAAWLAWLGPAAAGTPSAEKLAGAVAEANRKAGRAKPLLLDVALRTGEGPPSATGTLATHPTGLARLELRGADGLERHLLQGSQYAASRDGEILASPIPLLPPLFLLQADSGPSLRAALASFGVAASEAGLGLADDRDCYVIGGRGRGEPGDGDRDVGSHVPSLWVELGSFEVVAVDRADGVRYRFGPTGNFEGVRIPRWVEIAVPGEPPVRMEIQRVAKASAPAAAFGMGWLSGSP